MDRIHRMSRGRKTLLSLLLVGTIGTVAGVLQPIVVNEKLRNVPEQGIYNWDPGAYFGIYKPDGFWFDLSEPSAKSASATVSPPTPR